MINFLRIPVQIKDKRGFTMVELLIYMALFTMFMLVLTDLFSNTLRLQTETEATSSVQQDSVYILNRFRYDINRASGITTPATLGTQSTSLVLTIGGTSYTYALSGGNLQLTTGGNTDNLNSAGTTVSNLTFTRYGSSLSGKNTIKINFTLTSVATPRFGAESRSYQTTIGLR